MSAVARDVLLLDMLAALLAAHGMAAGNLHAFTSCASKSALMIPQAEQLSQAPLAFPFELSRGTDRQLLLQCKCSTYVCESASHERTGTANQARFLGRLTMTGC